jgi:NAD(P)-dependent dehydrogenase (short-subunit alcohol dehydrogenase family)
MSNKIAIITGASRGLGKSAALHLAAQGVDIIGTYHSNEAEAHNVLAEIEALGVRGKMLQLDVGDSARLDMFVGQVNALLSAYFKAERFDYLVNNAGVAAHASFAETSEAQFDQLMNVHFKGAFFLTQKLLPVIADGGRILNITTGLTRFSPIGYAAYAAMKGAVDVWTRYLANELGPRGINVNSLAPGAIATDFGGGAVRDNVDVNAWVAANTAMGRAGQPDDIGAAVAMLLGDGGKWITAQRIEASGGMFV